MIDTITATRFIRALVRDDSPTVFQTFDDNDERKKAKATRRGLARKFVGTLMQHQGVLGRFNTPNLGAGIFIQISAGGRGAQNVTAPRALMADDDTPGRVLDLSRLPPSATVESSPGKHQYYWFLSGEASVADFRRGQRQLAAAFDTDKSIHNPDRVMRLPGTLHLKYPDKPFRVRLVECHPDRRYTVAEILDAYPAPVGFVETKEAESEPTGASDPTAASQTSLRRVTSWLNRRNISYTIKTTEPNKVILDRCVFNPEHRGDNGMAIKIAPGGGIWAGCWHNSCGGNAQRWKDVKAAIGSWSGRTAGFDLGDHKEIAQRALGDLRLESPETLVYANGALHRYSNETFIWETVSPEEQDRQILDYSGLPRGLMGSMRIKWTDVVGTRKVMARLADRPGFFNAAQRGIMFTNGFLQIDAQGIHLRAPSSEQRQCERMPFDWDVKAPAARFLRFLREVFEGDPDIEDKIAFLQEFAGACLVGIAPQFQIVAMLLGEGSNGKSVFLNCIRGLFPESCVTAVRPQDFGNEYYRIALNGSRLNIVSELPEADILDSEAFKSVVDGSTISGRKVREEVTTFRNEAGHLFAANRLPSARDMTHGFWRRCRIVTFNRRFGVEEANAHLAEEILTSECPGIIAWAVQGAAQLLAHGCYTLPASSTTALEEWKRSADVVEAFVAECTKPVAHYQDGTPARDLYGTFRSWLSENGHRTMSSTTFGTRLRLLNVPKTKNGDGSRVYHIHVTYEPAIWS